MSVDDVTAAVNAALASDWKTAEKINQKILSDCPNDIDCLNRLGKALLEQGQTKQAVTVFKKVLKINKYDPIAQKNLDRATKVRPTVKPFDKTNHHPSVNFLEEPGKTKLVSLVNIASANTLFKQNYADAVTVSPRRHTVVVTDAADTYLGALPDDLGHRLSLLIKGGNKYDCYVKSVCKNSIIVFLRELERAKRFASTPSFPANSSEYGGFVREDAISQPEGTKPASADEDSDDDDGIKSHDEEEATE